MIGPHEILFAETSSELARKVEGREVLSFKEIMLARTETAQAALRAGNTHLPELKGNFEDGVVVARALQNIPIWQERLTSCTHVIYTPNGYIFVEWQGNGDFSNIIDRGVKYSETLWTRPDARRLDETTYNNNSGGCYLVEDWLKHPVLKAAVGDDRVLQKYGEIATILSHGRVGSAGKESVWCPQSLPEGAGRAWALGSGGDHGYPPNHTTKGHWTVVHHR